MIDLSSGLRDAVITMDENVGATLGVLFDLTRKLEIRVAGVEDALFGPLVQPSEPINPKTFPVKTKRKPQ